MLQNPTRRTRMEDVHRVIHSFDNKENVAFFGVYDGHGGRGKKHDLWFGMDWISC